MRPIPGTLKYAGTPVPVPKDRRRGTMAVVTPDGTVVARMKRSHKGHGRGMEVRRAT